MPTKSYTTTDSIVEQLLTGKITDTNIQTITNAYQSFVNITLPALKDSGLTFDQLVESTGLSRVTVQKYLAATKPASTTWGVAYKMAELYGDTLSDQARTEILEALNAVQTTIIAYVTSPLPSKALLTRYGAPEIRISRSSFDKARQRIKGTLAANNPIWSMRVNKLLLLYATIKNDEFFQHRNAVLQTALGKLGDDWRNRKSLVNELLKNTSQVSFDTLAKEIDVTRSTLFKWQRMTDDEWETYTLRADIIINIWDYLYPSP